MTLIELLRQTASEGTAAKSFTGLERRVALLLTDAADEIERLKATMK